MVARVVGLALLSCSSSQEVVDGGPDAPVDVAIDVDAGPSVVAVPLTVCSDLAYVAQVSIGAGQTFPLLFDTGSTTLGVAATGCSTCDVTPLYTPGSTATDTQTTANVQYAFGTWSGEIYDDTVALAPGPGVSMRFVAISTQKGFLQPTVTCGAASTFEGVIGFARGPEAAAHTDAFLDALAMQTSIEDVFAAQLCDGGGTLWLGGFDASATTGAPQYTPLLDDAIGKLYYSVDLESISVAGTPATASIATPSYPDTVLDTGTTALFLPVSAYQTLVAAITASSGFQEVFGADGGSDPFMGCVTVTQTKAQLDATLPALVLTYGTGSNAIQVQAAPTESYLYATKGTWCPAFYPQDPTPMLPFAAILGTPVLRSSVLVFDRVSQRMGFAPHAPCP